MIDKYVSINRILRRIMRHCINAAEVEGHDDGTTLILLHEYVRNDLRELNQLWPESLSKESLNFLLKLVDDEFEKGTIDNLYLATEALRDIEDEIDRHFGQANIQDISVTILDFLHPVIINSSYHHYRNSHYRDAVLNAVIAVLDLIRSRTGINQDGTRLVEQALSLNTPRLIIVGLNNESGRNEQKGMIEMLKGACIGIRNPKAHSLNITPNQLVAAQNLVFLSLLARRINDAQVVHND